MSTISKKIISLYFFILFISITHGLCRIPWTDKWWHGEIQILISTNHWSHYGECIEKNEEQHFLLKSNISRQTCYRCIFSTLVHQNVLQYKTTKCLSDPGVSVKNCREKFSGDAPMETLFRVNAKIEECPLRVPLNFTYLNEKGICKSRNSKIHQCVNGQRLRLEYEACPEMPNNEAIGMELECIGSWLSLGSRFLATRFITNQGKINTHRCILMDGDSSHGILGISADSKCHELTHLSAASTQISYKPDYELESLCDFPNEFQDGYWVATSTSQHHRFRKGEWTSSHQSIKHSKRLCISRLDSIGEEERDQSLPSHLYRVHVTDGCSLRYQCVKMREIGSSLIQLEFGMMSRNELDDCVWEMEIIQRETLIRPQAKTPCPSHGLHYLSSCQFPVFESGCSDRDHFHLRKTCEKNSEKISCMSTWTEGDQVFLIAKHRHHVIDCILMEGSRVRAYPFTACQGKALQFTHPSLDFTTIHSDNCNPGLLSVFMSSPSSHPSYSLLFLSFLSIFIIFHF